MSFKDSENLIISVAEQTTNGLNVSSAQNRNLLITFIVFELIISTIILKINDKNILFIDENILISFETFPFNMSYYNFFLIAPILLVGFHMNLFFNLFKHWEKLGNFIELVKDDVSIDRASIYRKLKLFSLYNVFPFWLNMIVSADFNSSHPQESFSNKILRIGIINFITLLCVFGPLIIIYMMFFKILDYQSNILTSYISIIYLFDFLLIFISSIFAQKLHNRHPDLRADLVFYLYFSKKNTKYRLFMFNLKQLTIFIISLSIFSLCGSIYNLNYFQLKTIEQSDDSNFAKLFGKFVFFGYLNNIDLYRINIEEKNFVDDNYYCEAFNNEALKKELIFNDKHHIISDRNLIGISASNVLFTNIVFRDVYIERATFEKSVFINTLFQNIKSNTNEISTFNGARFIHTVIIGNEFIKKYFTVAAPNELSLSTNDASDKDKIEIITLNNCS